LLARTYGKKRRILGQPPREDIAHPDLRRLPILSARPYLRYLRPFPPFRLTLAILVELARRIAPSRISEPSGSGGRPTPGITSAAEHAQQTNAEKQQAGRLRDDIDGEDAGGAVPAEGSGWEKRRKEVAAAARDIDTTDVAGKPTRPNFDEHPAAPAAAAAETAAPAALSAQDARTR